MHDPRETVHPIEDRKELRDQHLRSLLPHRALPRPAARWLQDHRSQLGRVPHSASRNLRHLHGEGRLRWHCPIRKEQTAAALPHGIARQAVPRKGTLRLHASGLVGHSLSPGGDARFLREDEGQAEDSRVSSGHNPLAEPSKQVEAEERRFLLLAGEGGQAPADFLHEVQPDIGERADGAIAGVIKDMKMIFIRHICTYTAV